MSERLSLGNYDLEALEAIRTAMYACNSAENRHLQIQTGTFGFMHDGFIDAATAIFNKEVANRLMSYLIDNGENVSYNLNIIRDEMCGVCSGYLEKHCHECGTCPGYDHNNSCSELACLGHETLDGPAGISAYCDGACRPKQYTTA